MNIQAITPFSIKSIKSQDTTEKRNKSASCSVPSFGGSGIETYQELLSNLKKASSAASLQKYCTDKSQIPSGKENESLFVTSAFNNNMPHVAKAYIAHPVRDCAKVIEAVNDAYEDEIDRLNAFYNIITFSYGEKSEKIQGNFDFLIKLTKEHPELILTIKDFQDIIDDDGVIQPCVQEKIIEYENYKDKIDPESYNCILGQYCVDNNEDNFIDGVKIFSNKKHLESLGYCPLSLFNICCSLREDRKESFEKSFAIQNEVLRDIEQQKNNSNRARIELNGLVIDLEDKEKYVLSLIGEKYISYQVSKNYIKTFNNSILGAHSAFDETIANSIPTLKNCYNGLPLLFPKEKFLEELDELSKEDKDLIHRLGIEPIYDENHKLIGYNDFISFKKLKRGTKEYNLCHKYFYENKVQTDNDELNGYLDTIIKAVPEFMNIIGKPQHGLQRYSLDTHILLVLANALNDSRYKNLSASDKFALKLACLFHDISKAQGVVDKKHPANSATASKKIIERFCKNEDTIRRITNLIKTHEWLGIYQNSEDKALEAKKIAFDFRSGSDFDLAKILTKADMKGVNDEFYEKLKGALHPSNLKPIEDNIKKYNSEGCALFSDYPIIKDDKTLVEYNHKNYHVINLNDIEDSVDMGKYGFEAGKKKEDLRFLVHMLPRDDIKACVQTSKRLAASATQDGFLSQSYIAFKNDKTFGDRRFGLIMTEANSNIINISPYNCASGYKKDKESIMEAFSEGRLQRGVFRHAFLNNLGISEKVDNDDYAKFYKKHLSNKTSLNQFVDSKKYAIGNLGIKGSAIKKAIIKYQDSILSDKSIINSPNEIVACNAKIRGIIAKAHSLHEIPQPILDFANEYDYPIVLI